MRILSLTPAYLIPLVASVCGIYVITRILSPEQYGLYALVLSVMALCQSGLFSWLDIGTKRFYERAAGSGRLPVLGSTIYLGLALSTALMIAACVVTFRIVQLDPSLERLLWIGTAVMVARQASAISKVLELAAMPGLRYTLMECGESLLGLAVGLACCWYAGLGPSGILLGMLAGAASVLLFDARRIIARVRGGRFNAHLQRQIVGFAAPICIAFSLEYIIASSDRILVGYFLGSRDLGIYAASYSIAERAVTALFLALGVASYPLVVRALEREGPEAARRQALHNAEILMAVTLPAWGGFTVAADHIAWVLIGPEYAAKAAELMPLTGVAIFLFALRSHYFAHAQHLTDRTWRLLISSAPAAALNLGLNWVLLPRIGLIGAVWASVIAYAVSLCISVWQARREFALPFPVWETLKAAAATLVMCGVLRACDLPMDAMGLVGMIMLGATLYGALVLALNIGRLRSHAFEMIERRQMGKRVAAPAR
jgi:O-antigen/teichoic acid export membrane protein